MTTSLFLSTMDSLITGPQIEPIDLEQAKKAIRFAQTAEDPLIDIWISAARQMFEEQTGRQLMSATWQYWLDGTPTGDIELPHPPLLSVDAITYDDENGDEQTFDASNYTVSAPAGPTCPRGRISLVTGAIWPTIITPKPNALRIEYTAGYGQAPGDVPELVKGALYFLIGNFQQFRSETYEGLTSASLQILPLGAAAILRSFRYSALPTLQPRASGITTVSV